MEEIAFSDWPGQTVDLSGSNPWLPAYGFQPPHGLLEKEDFIGNPDADLFLQGSAVAGQHYMYLETIQEETSDDLQSDSDISESKASPVGWLATDSESGSVIRIDTLALDEIDSESEREIACPAKRRRQDNANSGGGSFVFSDDDSNHSLSRSSSLLQFEHLERQCQDISSSSPSILSSFSFDSLESQRKTDVSPDSLERVQSDDGEPSESEYYKSLKVDLIRSKKRNNQGSRDSLLYNVTHRLSDSDSSESTDSERTLQITRKSTGSLKASRSFDNVMQKSSTREKMSTENLSEDSGYSDHLCNFVRNRSSSIPNLVSRCERKSTFGVVTTTASAANAIGSLRAKNSYVAFEACDVEYGFQTIATSFGSSYHDLSALDRYDVSSEFRSPLIERFMRNAGRISSTVTAIRDFSTNATTVINLEEKVSEFDVRESKYNAASASEPNLLLQQQQEQHQFSGSARISGETHLLLENNVVCVSSVPKDLNLAGGDLNFTGKDCNNWNLDFYTGCSSIAAKNCDIADFGRAVRIEDEAMKDTGENKRAFVAYQKTSTDSDIDMTSSSFQREGSYLEAMCNRIDLSDDEINPCYTDNLHKSTLLEFDKQILKTISETSIPSFEGSTTKMDMLFSSTPIGNQTRNVVSTPNLAMFKGDDIDISENEVISQNLPRKSSLVNRSTSASGVSDDEKALTSSKSFSGSTGSKGVHFCPVVAEVNWHDDSSSNATTEKDSTCSLSSTPDLDRQRMTAPPTPPLIRPIATRMSTSEPELQKVQQPESTSSTLIKSGDDFHYIPLRPRTLSQPDVGDNKLKRRGSKVVKKDGDGSILGSYVDVDGVQYQHSHLGDVYQLMPPTRSGSHVLTGNSSSTSINSDVNIKNQSQTITQKEKQRRQQPPGAVMDSIPARRESKTSKTGKLGGFFSRIASFRFSSRKNTEDKGKKKEVADATKASSAAVADVMKLTMPSQRIATKEDYIYIPLRGPEKQTPRQQQDYNSSRVDVDQQQVTTASSSSSSASTNSPRRQQQHPQNHLKEVVCISAKPPLPKVPPRVIGASVKRRPSGEAVAAATTSAFAQPSRFEYRTIDSGDALPRPMEPMGLIETDLDTEVTVITSGAHVKTRSLMNLGAEAPPRSLAAPTHPARPHKSMEFLLDKQNLKVVEPPENELQKGERVMSEHQLRIQRSLQKLTIPDWYKQSPVPKEGFLLRKTASRERWTGTSSKTPSLSSLGSGIQSPVVLSPTPQCQSFVRWSTSKLNSTASSPCASTRSSFNARQPNGSISPSSSVRSSFSYRQPYMGWRSQERLSRPRTPAERLASSLMVQGAQQQNVQQESPEIQTSIKEVTSAIVHYVSGLRPPEVGQDSRTQSRSNSVSPRGSQKLCWLESSFVGTRPVDAPETPVTLAESHTSTPPSTSNLRLELQKTHNDVSVPNVEGHSATTKPSPSSTTLEDVLDSLLGLPPSTRAPSPSHQETASANTSPSRLGEETRVAEQFRRHSEGSEPTIRQSNAAVTAATAATAAASSATVPRRISFHSSPVLRCRYSRCGRAVSAASSEAKAFKNCHNCSYIYCSRACRRAHWEKHRKNCLFSRVGALCRRVLAASKEQQDTLLQISLIARRGYLSHGPGAVKCFFPCPEAAEQFLADGTSCLGELTYVRWTDLLPTEMGPHMYTELVKMCKSYNSDTKLVLYVTVCVVSEVPTTGAVKWERQLVSRCAKMRLSRDVPIPDRFGGGGVGDTSENLETLVLTCTPTAEGKLREHVFSNIQNELKMRGVSLRKQYPEIYRQLCTYVEGKCKKFVPVTVYPKDDITGKNFMCIIMLESDPEGVRQVSAAGVRVNTVNLLQNCDL